MIEKISNFKDRLNKALSIRNMKPIELSEKTGISEATISQYRSGYSKPKDTRLYLIANVLNVNPVWLMGLNVPMSQHETSEDKPYNQLLSIYERNIKLKELIDLYTNVPPEIQDTVINLLKATQIPKEKKGHWINNIFYGAF